MSFVFFADFGKLGNNSLGYLSMVAIYSQLALMK